MLAWQLKIPVRRCFEGPGYTKRFQRYPFNVGLIMFKVDWEKAATGVQLPQGMIERMVKLAYPDSRLYSHELLAGGCANLNIKISLEGEKRPLIVRVYLRDKDASYREQKIGALLHQTVPVPSTYYVGKIDGYHFALTEFMPGISLRDLLLSDLTHDISAIMHEIAQILLKITAHGFPQAGFFDTELGVIPDSTSDDYLVVFAQGCLKNRVVRTVLTQPTIAAIVHYLPLYGHLFVDNNEKRLVHGDFDPANILVCKIDGAWKVSGILDWEFCFSGSVVCDIATMLRYAHKMPFEFQDAFLKGLASGGLNLPKNWRITIHLLNLLSLLDCLTRSDPKNKPNQCADISDLIEHILVELNTM